MAYLIDLRKVLNEFKENNKYHAAFKSLMQCIFDAPSVNAVEVVRCQFCKSFGFYQYSGKGYCAEVVSVLYCY